MYDKIFFGSFSGTLLFKSTVPCGTSTCWYYSQVFILLYTLDYSIPMVYGMSAGIWRNNYERKYGKTIKIERKN